MRSLLATVVVLSITTLAPPVPPADACTSFLLKHPSGPVMAKNYDWDVAAGHLVVNPRGLAKTSLVADGAKPVRWTSRYGSVTFNQYGREFPIGGMNEAGLAMEVLWLDGTVYPEAGDRRSIGVLQWIQYCLDSFRSVADVVASASELAIGGPAPLHFLACDRTANCAVIEFLDGQLVSRSERTLPLPVLTNNTFSESLEYLNRTLGYGGDPIKPEGPGSLPRFARAARGAYAARSAAGDDAVGDVFSILDDVAQPESTQWSIAYELKDGRVHFRTSGNRQIRTVELSGLDLDCTADPVVADLMADGAGAITDALVPYTERANRLLIEAGFTADSLTPPSADALATLAGYPETLLCTFDAASP
jgi:choloylglycine hydrolase